METNEVTLTIKDKSCLEPQQERGLIIEHIADSVYIRPDGYGDACSHDGEGSPVMLEVWEGELRVVIWGDINKEDPTHIISLEGAREEKRQA